MARPAKPDPEAARYGAPLQVKVNEHERRAISDAAARDGQPVTTWLREAGLEKAARG